MAKILKQKSAATAKRHRQWVFSWQMCHTQTVTDISTPCLAACVDNT